MCSCKMISVTFSLFLVFCFMENANVVTANRCSDTATAFPPDPSTECCGYDPSGSKRIGGSLTDIDEFPWLALIEYKRKDQEKVSVMCGGTLISARYVLTAAYCVTGAALSAATLVNIRLGEYNKTNDGPDCLYYATGIADCTKGERRIPIEKVIPHPEYSSRSKRNDIALVRMKENAPYTDFIRPICLPTKDITLEMRPIYFTMAGWGTALGPSAVKLHVSLPYVPLEVCQKSYEQKLKTSLWKGHICAGGEKNKDSCKGDGGMPLMYEGSTSYEVVGTVSFGTVPCGTENVPSVYTNVYEYKSWIMSTIEP